MNPDETRRAIVARYRTIHAFCRARPELKRSTVYLVLSGKYPGRTERQIIKIEAALAGTAAPAERRPILPAQEAYNVLQEAKCGWCRKLDKRGCAECNTQTAREAQALEQYVCARGEE